MPPYPPNDPIDKKNEDGKQLCNGAIIHIKNLKDVHTATGSLLDIILQEKKFSMQGTFQTTS